MITPQQRANHNMHCINEIERMIKMLHTQYHTTEAVRITSLLDQCFLIDDDLKYTKQLRRTYLTACQALDNMQMD
jgi:hypothetical protein